MDESHWLDTPELEAMQARMAGQRFAEDAWAEPIREFVAEMDEVSVPEVLIGCLQKPKSQWTTYDQTRVGAVCSAGGTRSEAQAGPR